jgi:predicted AlkP superfamily pyrophosphatase or phosphodiesterase
MLRGVGTLVLLVSIAVACAPARAATTILISLDGVHPGYLERSRTPTLNRLAKRGVRARWMIPSFPALTFPNHYTLVTGLVPDRHGIVANNMRDPALGTFSRHDPAAFADPRWFAGEPIWVTAQKQGRIAAKMFWPGSEAPIGGLRARHWHRFDYAFGPSARVDQVLEWLDLPAAERPHLITLYFEHADRAGHDYGPESPELGATLALLDHQIARLLRALAARGLRHAVNLVIVSDHGMAPVRRDRVVLLDDVLDLALFDPVNTGELLLLYPRAGREAELAAALRRPIAHLDCWPKGALPAEWRYGTHPRLPPTVCQADTGWRFLTRRWLNERRGDAGRGAHGYRPDDPTMRAIFIAQGPDIARGRVVEPFANVHVHAFLCALLELECPPDDGDAAVSREWLAKP